jgi:methionyl aminopeptidase
MVNKVDTKSFAEINDLRQGGKILSLIIDQLACAVRPGISTLALEKLAKKLLIQFQVKSSFLNYGQPVYPAATCISLNQTVVHGIPNKNIIKSGDIVSIDLGIWYNNLCTDMAVTVIVPPVKPEIKRLIVGTRQALSVAMDQLKANVKTGDIGWHISKVADKHNLTVVEGLTGHGVGRAVHEYPPLPNFGNKNSGIVLPLGAVVAIEPMFCLGKGAIKVADNHWDVLTADNSWSAHFEQTAIITQHGCEILTPYVSERYWK